MSRAAESSVQRDLIDLELRSKTAFQTLATLKIRFETHDQAIFDGKSGHEQEQ
jgi:hypothetical protein